MNKKVLAIVMLVVGLILLFFAYQASESVGDQLSEAVTGNFTDSTTWYLILGAAATAAGIGIMLLGGRTRN